MNNLNVDPQKCGNCGYPRDQHDALATCLKYPGSGLFFRPYNHPTPGWDRGQAQQALGLNSGLSSAAAMYEERDRVRAAAMTVAKPSSCWNGKCPRCGKGTYTGFVSVEHEGGACNA